MSERYSKLFALSENLYSVGAPVAIAAGALQKDNQTGKVFAQLKIRNIQGKTIKAAKVKVVPFDTVGKPLGRTVDYQYLDLSAERDTDFEQKNPVMLSDATTRSFSVSVVEVIYSDNSTWTASNEMWEPLSTPIALEQAFSDKELVKQYRVRYGADCKCIFKKEKDLWHCACGALNHDSETTCHSCQKEAAALAALNVDELKADRDERLAAEQKKAAEEKAAAAEQAKKAKKIAMIAASIVVVVIIAAALISNVMTARQNKSDYADAVALVAAGEYADAIEAFAALDGYEDSEEWATQRVAYEKALYLLDCAEREDETGLEVTTKTKPEAASASSSSGGAAMGGEEAPPDTVKASCASKAITILNAIEGYKDTTDLLARANALLQEEIAAEKEAEKEAWYAEALDLLNAGESEDAYDIFYILVDYKDSAEKREEAFLQKNIDCFGEDNHNAVMSFSK